MKLLVVRVLAQFFDVVLSPSEGLLLVPLVYSPDQKAVQHLNLTLNFSLLWSLVLPQDFSVDFLMFLHALYGLSGQR